MKKVKQFRFFSSSDSDLNTLQNYPEGISTKNLVSGSIFKNYFPIIQLGIQTLPGTKFYVNKGIDPIIINYSGIFTLDITDGVEISHLSFDLDSINSIDSNSGGYLIIDIIYEAED